MSIITLCLRRFLNFPKNLSQCCKFSSDCTTVPKSIQVCVLGADTQLGGLTSFLLKQNPLISLLHLQGSNRVDVIGKDISSINTKCKVRVYHGDSSVPESVRCADIILMLGMDSLAETATFGERIMGEGYRVSKLVKDCTEYAPKSILVVCVRPISVTLEITEELYKKSDWYHPSRIIGSITVSQVKANSIAGNYQNLDPQSVNVPILGGPDIDCAVPLFSISSPIGVFEKDAKLLTDIFRENANFQSPVSEAIALNRMVSAIGSGLCGDDEAVCCAFVRSNLVNSCKHIVSKIQFGPGGVIHNFGIPKLTKLELNLFEKATLLLKEREQIANEYVCFLEDETVCKPAFMVKEMEDAEVLKRGIIR